MQKGAKVRLVKESMDGIINSVVDLETIEVITVHGTILRVSTHDIVILDHDKTAISQSEIGRLSKIANLARNLAHEWQANLDPETQIQDELGQIESALNTIALGLEMQRQRLSLQYAITKLLEDANSLDGALPDVLKATCEGLGWQWSALWTIDNEYEVLRCGPVWLEPMNHIEKFAELSKRYSFKRGEGIVGRVWKGGTPEWIVDVQDEQDFHRADVARLAGLRGAFFFPIRATHGVLGVMEFLTVKAEVPDNSLLAMFNALGSQIGQFIERKIAEEQHSIITTELELIQKQLQQDFARRMQDTQRLKAQHAATKVLAEADALDEAMPDILQAICESLDWQWSALWTIDDDTQKLYCGKVWHSPDVSMEEFTNISKTFALAVGVGLPGRVWEKGAPAWIVDVQVDPNFPRAPVARQVGLRGAFCFPIHGSLGILGVMEFLTTRSEEPDNSLLAMLDAIGSQIGQFIERKLAEEQNTKKTAELEKMHKRLQQDLALRQEDNTRLKAQHAATKVLADSPGLTEATPQLLNAICIGLDWECALMWELDEKGDILRWVNCWCNNKGDFRTFQEMSRNMEFKKGTGLPGRVWETATPHWILDVVNDPNFPRAAAAAKAGLHGAFAFPIILGDRVLGVMEFFSAQPQEPDSALLAMMAAIGSQVGQFIERKLSETKALAYLIEVEKEKERSKELLHVILPADIVRELEDTDAVQSRRYENVAVLFCDIVGFTKYCTGLGPEEIVSKLQKVVEAYEGLCEKYTILKIKTIGDCFMAVSGLLPPVDVPVLNALKCGLEMNTIVHEICPEWSVRVGISLGPVVAGVLGRKQYQFDIWGDTVNVAARMESNGEPTKIVMSKNAWDSVSDLCYCDSLGIVEVKGKGKMELFRFQKWKEGPVMI